LIPASARLAGSLLCTCPDLHVLATSREPLSIDGEQVLRVPSLAPPEPPDTPERVVLELRDKLDGLALPGDGGTPAEAAADQAIRAAVDGLATMGFREAAARDAVKAAVSEGTAPLDVAALVAAALRRLDMVPAG